VISVAYVLSAERARRSRQGRRPGGTPLGPAEPAGLAEVTVELSLKLAEAFEHIAAEEGLPTTDVTEEVWFTA